MVRNLSSVGIVTRTRERPAFVARALRSVLAQTHADWHLVVVNDGGDPGLLRTAIAAARVPPDRLTLLDHPQPRGRAGAFNAGLAALETDFIACLDDDDTWEPEFLAALVAHFNQNAALVPDLGGCASGVTALREDVTTGPDGSVRIEPLGEDSLPHAFLRSDFILGPIAYATYRHDLYPVQWLLRRPAVAELGGFPEAFEVMEDRAFLLRFVQHWRIATLPRPLAHHHRRVRRSEDGARSVEMNTLDNPSYDWRRFADLALPSLTSPAGGMAEAELPGLIRAVGASIVKELNDETSAIWHKVNGEAKGLRDRLDALEARLGGRAPAAPLPLWPQGAVWSLWPTVGAVQIGYGLAPAIPFLDRLEVAAPGITAGLLFVADPDRREAVLQVPETGASCALELNLGGLATPGRGLTCEAVLEIEGGALFETGFVRAERDALGRTRHALVEPHVHAARPGAPVRISRHVAPELLAQGARTRFSIILPRKATNLRLVLHDLVVVPG